MVTSSYQTLTDHELAPLLSNGDHEAFSEIYRRYWKKLFVVASKRLGDEGEAEEIVQDVFLNLWRRRTQFQLTTTFNNYFSVAVKFEILDIMRKRLSASTYEQNLVSTYTEADISALRQLDMQELQEKLQLGLKELPEKCQLAFRLRLEHGFSQKQIAEHMNISEKTVEAHLSKARKILKSVLGDLFCALLFIF